MMLKRSLAPLFQGPRNGNYAAPPFVWHWVVSVENIRCRKLMLYWEKLNDEGKEKAQWDE